MPSAFVQAVICLLNQPTLNVVQKCEVVSGRRRKGTWAAEEAVERGGLVFQILFVDLCCVVRAPAHWWKKERLKKIRTWEGKKW